MIDGLANELQSLAASVILLVHCMGMEMGSCNFPK